MINRKYILIILVFILSALALGLLIALIVSWYVLYAIGISFNFNSLIALYEYDSVYYLIRLIPFFTMLGGLLLGRVFMKEQKKHDVSAQKNINIIQTIKRYIKKINNDELDDLNVDQDLPSDLVIVMEDIRQHLLALHDKEEARGKVSSIIAEINELLRPINELKQLAHVVVEYLVNTIESAVQGAFYIATNNAENPSADTPVFKLSSRYAYNRIKHLQKEVNFSDGLIGQAAIEKDIIHLTEIPEDYVSITSGLLGHKKPNSILIQPFVHKGKVNGVIELASVGRFSEFQIRMISEMSAIVARTISSVQAHEKTVSLLRESDKMRAELMEQKKQLMKNAQEMISTQKELEKANETLESQMQEVRTVNQKTHLILENSLEIVFIYDADKIITYVSPSILPVLGYYPDDIIGKRCIENMHPMDTDKFDRFLSEIVSFPEQKHSLQYRYFSKNGDVLWMEAIGNISTSDLIEGIVLNVRDMSEHRKAQKEQRMRAKMQALSENSPDIIIRIDIYSRCTYINPAIERISDMKVNDFINKPLKDVGLDESVIQVFEEMLTKVSQARVKMTDEMLFPFDCSELILEVSAIPEFDETGDIGSVLFVCHDITTARNREKLISKKNKSIQDSINYAYYIQSSLMPTETQLQSLIPDSFMLYMPKDIVSGDYPFLYHEGGIIYIGAMDCTGHGVPGALMSLIGYFLQNEIIHESKDENAGQILTRLHKKVVNSLRQEDEDSKINDGMDAAFCKIDLKTNKLDFAGAHRPLYYVKNGEFNEIRGDRYPVGSTQYSNRKDFSNHCIDIGSGDSFYLTTDGYADQYGGPDGKRKFLSGRVSMLIRENTDYSFSKMKRLFENTHVNWKGNVAQLDDILVIGLKF